MTLKEECTVHAQLCVYKNKVNVSLSLDITLSELLLSDTFWFSELTKKTLQFFFMSRI